MSYAKQAETYVRIAEELLEKDPDDPGTVDAIVDNYEKAGNMYKLGKNELKAGELYEKCALLYIKNGRPHQALDLYSSAISVYKEDHLQLAVTVAKQLAEIAMQTGSYSQAGKVLQDLAILAETKEDYDEAYNLYTKAETAFKNDRASINEHRNCRIRLAEIGACVKQSYELSASIFEDVAVDCIQSPVLYDMSRNFFLSSFLCMIFFKEEQPLWDALQRFEKHNPTLVGSPEGEFMYECISALKKMDPIVYETSVTKLRNRISISLTTNIFKRRLLILIGAKLGCGTIEELL